MLQGPSEQRRHGNLAAVGSKFFLSKASNFLDAPEPSFPPPTVFMTVYRPIAFVPIPIPPMVFLYSFVVSTLLFLHVRTMLMYCCTACTHYLGARRRNMTETTTLLLSHQLSPSSMLHHSHHSIPTAYLSFRWT
jgi:type IV secretory pathway VirB3-like protein